jgi:hypothetical protein
VIARAYRRWSSPAWFAVGLALACGPRASESDSGESVGQATDDPGETDDGATSAESGCPNDSEARTGYCFERVDLAFENPEAVVGDFLGDGLTDLALSYARQPSGDDFSIFQWTGSMTPIVATTARRGNVLLALRGVGNDRDEILSIDNNRLRRYRVVDGTLQEGEAETWPGSSVGGMFPLVAIDADLDGSDEIIAIDFPRARDLDLDYDPVVVVEDASEGWTVDRDLPLRSTVAAAATVADLTGDGQVELVVGEQGSHPAGEPYDPARDFVVVFRPTPQGLVEIARAPMGVQHWMLATGDVDGDGLLDILVPRYVHTEFLEDNDDEPHPIAVLRNLGGGMFEDPVLVDLTHVRSSVAAIDLDGDGRDELLFEMSKPTSTTERNVVVLADPLRDSELVTLVDEPGAEFLVADFNDDGVDDVGYRTADEFHLLMPIR